MADRDFCSKESKRLKAGRSLAVVCGFSACFVFAAARRSRAETPAGLDAQGVSVSWAIHNSLGLDVRDALARPVSARLVEEQLKSAQAHAAGRAAYASRLPLAKALIRFFEFLPALRLFMAGGFPAPARNNAQAVSMSPKSSPKAEVPVPLGLGVAICAAALFFQRAWRPAKPYSLSTLPLRC